jgi:hypothetical protein
MNSLYTKIIKINNNKMNYTCIPYLKIGSDKLYLISLRKQYSKHEGS